MTAWNKGGGDITEPCPICGTDYTEPVSTRWGCCTTCKHALMSICAGRPVEISPELQAALDSMEV